MAQLGGIVMMDPENKAAQQNFFFGGIEACKFRKPVVPGDTLVQPRILSLTEVVIFIEGLCLAYSYRKQASRRQRIPNKQLQSPKDLSTETPYWEGLTQQE